jgi:hypothetical protein
MTRDDFFKLIGAESGDAEYLPVACLLRSGYGCVGYFNHVLNEGLDDACVLVNGRLIELRDTSGSSYGQSIKNFNDFLEQIVHSFDQSTSDRLSPKADAFGTSIPLTAIPLREIAIVYPVAHISAMMQRLREDKKGPPTFLDFDKSVTLKLLRKKLW